MNPAASKDIDAAIAVARRFPLSRKTVEKSAEVNATASPAMAMKKRIHAERSILAKAALRELGKMRVYKWLVVSG